MNQPIPSKSGIIRQDYACSIWPPVRSSGRSSTGRRLPPDLLVQNTTPKTRPITIANTPTAIPTFCPCAQPTVIAFQIGAEEVEEAGVVLSDDGVTVMTVYVANEVEGVAPSTEVVADVLGAADSAEVWLHCPLPTGVGITDLV
jgi:hypothetical protein